MRKAIMAVICLAQGCILIGCNTPVDEKMMAVRDQAQTADAAFMAASRTFVGGASQMADKKHALQVQIIDETWTAWVAANTNAAGMVTIPAAKLAAALAKRDEAKATLLASQEGWQKYVGAYRDAIVSYEAMNAAVWSEEGKIMEAKRTTQAALQAALTALGSVAAGFGAGALAF